MIEYEIPFVCLIFTALISFVFFLKKKVDMQENYYYKNILIFTLCVHLTNFVSHYLASIYAKEHISDWFAMTFSVINKFGSLFIMIITINLLSYILYISFENYRKNFAKNKIINWVSYAIIGILLFFLNFDVYKAGGLTSGKGLAVVLTFTVAFINIIAAFIISLFNFKKYDKRYNSIYFIIPLIFLLGIFVMFHPQFNIYDLILSLLCYLMYFTIENPDLKMIEELNFARERAEKANNAKTDFLSSMSHEIRTPLNAIVGFSQNLYEEDIPESAKDQIKDIISASDSLLDIVNGILDISKIEANKLEIINDEYSFEKIFKELSSLAKVRIGDKDVVLKTSYDDSIPKVLYGDKVRVKQVILNILTNSVKYTKSGFVEFKVNSVIKDDICRIIVSVEDSGIGIKRENLDKLFTKFQRFEERNTTIEGTGLGLAITKKLVDLMGGQIVAQSIYGQGSKFTIALDQKIVNNPKRIVEDSTEDLNSATYDLLGKRVLIVDDNSLNLKVASKLLEKYKLEIDTANSGFECIDKIMGEEQYDLVLLDDMMPKMSGVDTFSKLKQIKEYNTPTVILTANAIAGMRDKYLNDGFDDYLAKPIEKAELNKVLKRFLMNNK